MSIQSEEMFPDHINISKALIKPSPANSVTNIFQEICSSIDLVDCSQIEIQYKSLTAEIT